jgi:hypothetical protein
MQHLNTARSAVQERKAGSRRALIEPDQAGQQLTVGSSSESMNWQGVDVSVSAFAERLTVQGHEHRAPTVGRLRSAGVSAEVTPSGHRACRGL